MIGTVAAAPSMAVSLADPTGSSVLLPAALWIQGALLGTIATVIAVIAVAAIGAMMLSGRMNVRHAAVVILGCFILFGASTIAAGIRSMLPAGEVAAAIADRPPPSAAPLPPPPQPSEPAPYDPYAGASVPTTR